MTSNAILDKYPTVIDALFNCNDWDKINRIGKSATEQAHDILVSINETTI